MADLQSRRLTRDQVAAAVGLNPRAIRLIEGLGDDIGLLQQLIQQIQDALAAIGTPGDFSSDTATAVVNELVLFADATGKLGKRSTGTGFATLLDGALNLLTAEEMKDALGIVEGSPAGDPEEDGAWDPDSQLGSWGLDSATFNKATFGATGPSIRGISALPGRAFGKRYLEFSFDAGTIFSTSVRHDLGITRHRQLTSTAGIGGSLCDTGAGYRMGGAVNIETAITAAPTLTAGTSIVSLAVDLSTGDVWLAKDGVWVSGDPATGTAPSGTIPVGGLYYPCASCESGASLSATLRVIEADFDYPIPDGFKSWGSR